MNNKVLRIAGGQGFYGDTPSSIAGLLEDGIDYLCLEALAELTLAILQKDRARDESRGYTRDLPVYLKTAMPAVAAGRVKVITNAGGMNPTAAAGVAAETARDLGITGLRIATVLGDDLFGRLDELHSSTGSHLNHLDTGAEFHSAQGDPRFFAAYLGAKPIVEALDAGADIVITGRVADAALFLAPLIHEFGWAWDDWDRLAAGALVGHLLECSGQTAGGNFSGDWSSIPEPWKLPYPIAEVEADGTAVITKPVKSGGRVDFDTVRHQLLYEVSDPTSYMHPDVVADFTTAQFEDLGDDRVRITGVRGKPATPTYKAVLAHHSGWSGEARAGFAWPYALEKAETTAAIFARRVAEAGYEVAEWRFEYWGVDALGGAVPMPESAGEAEPREVGLRVAWRCDDERTAASISREMVPLMLSAPPAGHTTMGRAASGSTELLEIWPTLVEKSFVDPGVTVTIQEV